MASLSTRLPSRCRPGSTSKARVLVVDAGGARLEPRAIGVAPPAPRPPLRVEVGASGVEGVGEIVGDAGADAAVELRVVGVGSVADGQEEAGRQDDLVQLRVDVGEGRRRGQLPDVAVGGLADAPAVRLDVPSARGGDVRPEARRGGSRARRSPRSGAAPPTCASYVEPASRGRARASRAPSTGRRRRPP